MEHARESERPCNLTYRPFILEAKRKEQVIGGSQLFERSSECECELLSTNSRIGLVIGFVYQLVGLNLLGNEIFKSFTCPLFMLPILIFTTRAAISLAKVIVHESASDHDEP